MFVLKTLKKTSSSYIPQHKNEHQNRKCVKILQGVFMKNSLTTYGLQAGIVVPYR